MLKPAVFLLTLSLSLVTLAQTEQPSGDASSESAAAAPKFGSSFSTHSSKQLLAKGLPQDQITWLEVGGKKVLSLYHADYSGKARGGVILLANPNQAVTTSSPLYNLQLTLPDNRWHALTINTPINSDGQLLASAIRFLNDKGIFNMVLLGEGASANLVAEYASKIDDKNLSKQIRGIAILNAYGTGIEQQIGQLPFPILDIYFDDNPQHRLAARSRQLNSKGLRKGQFQQVRMPRVSYQQRADSEGRLAKRIRGWLDKRAAGFSVGINKR